MKKSVSLHAKNITMNKIENDSSEPKETIKKEKLKGVNSMDNNDNGINEMLKFKVEASVGLGMKLEKWYAEYNEHIKQYDNKRQLNALLNMRKGVVELFDILPREDRRKYEMIDFNQYETIDPDLFRKIKPGRFGHREGISKNTWESIAKRLRETNIIKGLEFRRSGIFQTENTEFFLLGEIRNSSESNLQGCLQIIIKYDNDNIYVFFGEGNDHVVTLEEFGGIFIRHRNKWWDISPDGDYDVPMAIIGMFFFYQGLNNRINELQALISYDIPYDEGCDSGNQVNADGNDSNNAIITQPEEETEELEIPHFGLDPREKNHWEYVYYKLEAKGWIRTGEVKISEWVYICCGVGDKPKKKIIWHGTTAVLAYIIRHEFVKGTKNNWETAREVFILKNNKALPKSFKTTKPPAKKVKNKIDITFFTH